MLTRVGSHPLGWASNFKVSARSEWFLGMDRLAAPTGQRDRITEVNFVRRHSSRAANECRFHSDHDAPGLEYADEGLDRFGLRRPSECGA
jgi:hypothetical protein